MDGKYLKKANKKVELTRGEALIVAGKTMINIGNALEGDNKITIQEWMNIAASAAKDAWQEMND